jgi:cell division protein FtsN
MEANVQQVMVGDKVWYRVRLGPYGKPDDAAKAKAELSKLGVEASIVKGKD